MGDRYDCSKCGGAGTVAWDYQDEGTDIYTCAKCEYEFVGIGSVVFDLETIEPRFQLGSDKNPPVEADDIPF